MGEIKVGEVYIINDNWQGPLEYLGAAVKVLPEEGRALFGDSLYVWVEQLTKTNEDDTYTNYWCREEVLSPAIDSKLADKGNRLLNIVKV